MIFSKRKKPSKANWTKATTMKIFQSASFNLRPLQELDNPQGIQWNLPPVSKQKE